MLDDLRNPKEIKQYLNRLELSMQSVQRRLRRFEEEFGMDSEAFYAKMQNAQLDERVEYSEWAGEHEMLQRLKKQKAELEARLNAQS
jgi:hypothetical protein